MSLLLYMRLSVDWSPYLGHGCRQDPFLCCLVPFLSVRLTQWRKQLLRFGQALHHLGNQLPYLMSLLRSRSNLAIWTTLRCKFDEEHHQGRNMGPSEPFQPLVSFITPVQLIYAGDAKVCTVELASWGCRGEFACLRVMNQVATKSPQTKGGFCMVSMNLNDVCILLLMAELSTYCRIWHH